MGIFNASAPFLSDLNLLFQVVIAAVLMLALFAIVKKKYVIHGVMMGCGVALHTTSIFIAMLPSLQNLGFLTSGFSTRLSSIVIVHAAIGSAVEVLGVLLVVLWIFNRTKPDNCFRMKRIMWATMILWMLEFFLGIYIYTLLYPFV
jgi:uncharacterized membrane protein YozB (DUF420 family)